LLRSVSTQIFRRRVIGVLAGLLPALAGGGCSSSHAPRTPLDLSGPKAAALTFLRAISAGDVRTAQSACIGSNEEKASVGAMSTLISGLRAYDQAISTHFGLEAVQSDTQLKQAIADLADTPIQHIESAIVKEGPLTASVEPAAGGIRLRARPPIYLRKQKEFWKVDLSQTSQADPRFGPDITKQYLAAGNALHRAASRINAGRYHSLAEAQRDTDAALP
jgi:hypothetical protein